MASSTLASDPAATELLAELERMWPDGSVHTRALDRLAGAHDASHYRIVPEAVVTPSTADDVAGLFALAGRAEVPVVFRSGGTSLNGQALTDGILVDARKNFRRVEVLDGGERVRVQPGATVRAVNARLLRHGRKLGPDPASEAACTLGGVIANNSSGMACGTELNTYRTLESMVYILPSGTIVDSADPAADDTLAKAEPELYAGLGILRDRILDNPESRETIRRQFALKNTMGYSLNAFVDFERPIDILTHLVIGSEGTLAFVAEATLRTVPLHPHAATALLIFADLPAATAAIAPIVATGAATIELLDAVSLAVAQRDPDAPEPLRSLPVADHAALLVEYQAPDAEGLAAALATGRDTIDRLGTALPAEFTTDAAARAELWHIRKDLYATIAENRSHGTTALLEDVVVPVPELLTVGLGLQELFAKHGYHDTVIFGHAKDGNLHFMLTEHFEDPASRERYARFSDDMVDLILGHGGSLKAEHGTGRMMAPYVERQYGAELFAVMTEVKRLCDPRGLLGPGTILLAGEPEHLSNLKDVPTVEEEVDRCVECGYCEPVCPSRDLTMTPRQRIVLRRERAMAVDAGDMALAAELDEEYEYDGVSTCAVDGMCMTACPVRIDTGLLVKRLRAEGQSGIVPAGWKQAARHWETATTVGGLALTAAKAAPGVVAAGSRAARRVAGRETVPEYSRDLPAGGTRRHPRHPENPDAVFFPACIGAMFAPARAKSESEGPVNRRRDASPPARPSRHSRDAPEPAAWAPAERAGERGSGQGIGASEAFSRLCERAGVRLLVPDGIGAACCGTPWKSKGMRDGYADMSARTLNMLWEASDHGRLPVVCDASSCTEGLAGLLEAHAGSETYAGLDIQDAVRFVHDTVLPRLGEPRRLESVALHPTCSTNRMGTTPALVALAGRIAETVTVPDDWNCCAFAGDRGMLYPELTASATKAEAAEVCAGEFSAYASSNRTCELGMTRATGHPYRHILELVEEATRPRPS